MFLQIPLKTWSRFTVRQENQCLMSIIIKSYQNIYCLKHPPSGVEHIRYKQINKVHINFEKN